MPPNCVDERTVGPRQSADFDVVPINVLHFGFGAPTITRMGLGALHDNDADRGIQY
jgi:hypothetical protein